MEPSAILYANYLDLIFENRNKLYGAYPLRKYYPERLFAAIGIVFGMVLIFVSILVLFGNTKTSPGQISGLPDIVLTSVSLDPPTVIKTLTSRAAAPVKQVTVAVLTNPLIVKDKPIPESMTRIDELKIAEIGIRTELGPPATEGPVRQSGISGGTGAPERDSVEAGPKIWDRTEIMPEFPGGQHALMRYLSRNLRMPDSEKEPGNEVRVIVKFVVGPDGKVTGINTIQSGGTAFDHEVQRVISRMPTWKPGIQNGRRVSVYYNLPVNFIIPAGN